MQQQKMRALQQKSEWDRVAEISWRTFIEFVERPFGDGHGIENGLPEIWAAQRVQAGVCGGPNDVAVPLNKNVVHCAIVASEFFQNAPLWRDEVSKFFRFVKNARVGQPHAPNEKGIV